MNLNAVRLAGILASFQLEDGAKMFMLNETNLKHIIIIAKDSTGGHSWYIDKSITEEYTKALRGFLHSALNGAHPDLTLPIVFNTMDNDIKDYKGSRVIVRDYHKDSFANRGVLPVHDDDIKIFTDLYNFSFSKVYKKTEVPTGNDGVDLTSLTGVPQNWDTYWNDEEKANMAYNLNKFGKFSLPESNKELAIFVKSATVGVSKSALFHGPAASMKSFSAWIISCLLKIPAYSIVIDNGTEREDLLLGVRPVGTQEFDPALQAELDSLTKQMMDGKITDAQYTAICQSPKFNINISGVQLKEVKSVFLKAFVRGGMAIPEEMNVGRASIFTAFNNMLDGIGKITLPNGEVLYRHQKFYFIACINPLYEDVQEMNEAMVSRFDNAIRFYDPTKAKVTEIMDVTYNFTNVPFIDKAYEYFEAMIRHYNDNPKYKFRLSYRELEAFIVQSLGITMMYGPMTEEEMSALMNCTMISKMAVNMEDSHYDELVQLSKPYAQAFLSTLTTVSGNANVDLGLVKNGVSSTLDPNPASKYTKKNRSK